MIIFAFPGTGKTTLDKRLRQAIELEISEIKYDNSGVSHLSKEARKALPRPLKSRDYRSVYIRRALDLHAQGMIVLVAINFLLPILWELWLRKDHNFHIYLPQRQLREEYRQRYIRRGNNKRFIREVMWVWDPTILLFSALSKLAPSSISFLKSGEFLTDKILPADFCQQKSNPSENMRPPVPAWLTVANGDGTEALKQFPE